MSNRVQAGDVAGFGKGGGYRALEIEGRTYQAGRVIWALMTGHWPTALIDHRDGDPSNYRWDNLREATRQQNGVNRRKNRNNTSGVRGVTWDRGRKRWAAWRGAGQRIGRFATIEQAAAARSAYEAQAHGAFRRAVSSGT